MVDTGDGPRPCRRSRSSPTAASTTTRPATPPARTEFVVPAELADDVAAECARVAVAAHEALGLRDLSRSDLIVDAERHGLVPRGQRRARADRDLDWSRCRSRPPGSTSATSGRRLVRAAVGTAPLPRTPRHERASPTRRSSSTAKLGFRALGLRFQLTGHRARPPHRRRAAGAQPHLLRRLHPRRLRRRSRRPAGPVHGEARAVRPPVDRSDDAVAAPHLRGPGRRRSRRTERGCATSARARSSASSRRRRSRGASSSRSSRPVRPGWPPTPACPWCR